MNILRTLVIGLALVLVAPACSNDQAGPTKQPTPGTATVALVTPNADDGAVLLRLTGPGLSNPQPNQAYLLYSRIVNSNELRVIVVSDLGATALITLHVDDRNRVSEYAGTVVDAASRSDQSRSSLAGYAVKIAATP